MEVTLQQAGGRYAVHAASGRTYEVDATRDECTCPDYLQNEPEGGCKHIRRVKLELRARRVPTPSGRVPTRVAADGGTTVENRDSDTPTSKSIQGPIEEFDPYGNRTGATYFRCRDCGSEAIRKRDLRDCCEGAE